MDARQLILTYHAVPKRLGKVSAEYLTPMRSAHDGSSLAEIDVEAARWIGLADAPGRARFPGTLLISSEGGKGRATLSGYAPR